LAANGDDLQFVDPTGLAAAFSAATELTPLDAGWLASDLEPELLRDLGRGELDQVKYWNPRRVGDLIFNRWD